jgi:hypothetical protein
MVPRPVPIPTVTLFLEERKTILRARQEREAEQTSRTLPSSPARTWTRAKARRYMTEQAMKIGAKESFWTTAPI